MGDMAPNFNRSEFACHCGCGLDSIHPDTVAALQKLRDLAKAPVVITCGCRCAAHNAAVGGAAHSFHLPDQDCRASDWQIAGLSIDQMYALAEQIPEFYHGGIGRYYRSGFIHSDTRSYQSRWADREV